ncbi:MAG: O-antigen ligase family protein [Burkholderiales bacterium]
MIGAVISYGSIFGMAFGLAVAIVIGGALALHFGQRVRNEPAPLVFLAIVAAIMVAPLATQRVLSAGLAGSEATVEEIGSSFWFSRVATLFVVALCAERTVRYFFNRRNRPPLGGWPLLWSFFAFTLSSQILNGMFGANPSFDHKWLYAFPVYFTFFVVAQQQPERCFAFARWALLVFLVGSAAAVTVRPTAVIEFGFAAALPGFSFRYYGLATHANTMGPLTVALMVILWRFPFGNRWVNRFAWAMAAGSLVLSQSKTSLGIAAGLWLFLAIHGYRARLREADRARAASLALALWCAACLAGVAIVAGVMAGANYVDWVLGKLDIVTGGQWATLSGRTRIWALAWKEFNAYPLFGYGPSIWDPLYRYYAQMPFASHAHNQLLQSLSSGGLVAGVTLVIYATTLTTYALRSAAATGGVSVALVAMMLVRGISEVPFSTASVMQAEFIIHLLALVACLAAVRPAPAMVAPVPPTRPARTSGRRLEPAA